MVFKKDGYSSGLSSAYLKARSPLKTVLTHRGSGSQSMRTGADPVCKADLADGPTSAYWANRTSRRWCWSSKDSAASVRVTKNQQGWDPQGVGSTFEADGGDGAIQGQRAAFVAWAREPGTSSDPGHCGSKNAVHVSFVNLNGSPSKPRYVNVMLVRPGDAGTGNFQASGGHGGGVALYGNYLYVTNTLKGIDVYDLHKIVATTSTANTVGQAGKTITGCSYPYVLPRQATYSYSYHGAGGTSCPRSDNRTSSWCFSSLSLYRPAGGGVDLVIGEHLTTTQAGHTSTPARIALFSLEAGTVAGLGKHTVTDRTQFTDGSSSASSSPYGFGAQGTLITAGPSGNPQFFFNGSCGPDTRGHNWLVTALNDTHPIVTCGGELAKDNWAYRPEGLAYSAVDGYYPESGGVRTDTEGAHPILVDVPYDSYRDLASSS